MGNKAINWQGIIGQHRVLETLSRSYIKSQLGQAYLFSGIAGTGKFTTALQLALTLLCESENAPCFHCTSCQRVLSHSHPDFRYIFPIKFASEHKVKSQPGRLTPAGWEYISERAKAKLNAPYTITPDYNASIPVDWIREVNRSIQRGATEAPYSVVIMEGIEHFRAESANAMLKTLEEPPANTVIILLTRSVHGVLPTVISRCQLFRFTSIGKELLTEEAGKRYPQASGEQLEMALFRGKGSPGVVFSYLQEEEELSYTLSKELMARLFTPSSPFDKCLALEEFVYTKLEDNFSLAQEIIETFIEEVRISFLAPFQSEQKYIFKGDTEEIPLPNITPKQAEEVLKAAEDTLLSIRRHTSLLVVFAEFELRITGIIHDQR